MSDRGMKKWAPYKSLFEQASSLQQARENKNVVEKPTISNEEAEEINNILVNYQGQILIIKYYRNQKIIEDEIVIKRIDAMEKKLYLTDRRVIKFSELVGLKNKE